MMPLPDMTHLWRIRDEKIKKLPFIVPEETLLCVSTEYMILQAVC